MLSLLQVAPAIILPSLPKDGATEPSRYLSFVSTNLLLEFISQKLPTGSTSAFKKCDVWLALNTALWTNKKYFNSFCVLFPASTQRTVNKRNPTDVKKKNYILLFIIVLEISSILLGFQLELSLHASNILLDLPIKREQHLCKTSVGFNSDVLSLPFKLFIIQLTQWNSCRCPIFPLTLISYKRKTERGRCKSASESAIAWV